ncbi:arylsulfatase A-like enzyme [Dyadobacter jejuensis]|uniref:Arylsulfatase A-like enzyme n=1 Tax=Dyadobacter jejuensis TaxID=1082580 RepID=A0A316ANE2_9BACT|nr:arylsulfatase [Dyadobacter jejuensis]PWJ58644.1 arylsulfatase A-like enzyme [Dyadobacter jejuensis]
MYKWFIIIWLLPMISNIRSYGQTNGHEKNPPNIIFILADDMGFGDPQCYNPESKISTPHIDKLALQGMKFMDAHSAGSWCVPSRYGLMTGQYPLRKHMDVKNGALIDQGQLTIASLLKRNGYATAMIGKWHLGFEGVSDWGKVDYSKKLTGGPIDRGFDYFFGMHASLDIPPYFFIENDQVISAPTEDIAGNQSPDATTTISGAFWREGKVAPGFKHVEVLPTFTDKALSFLEKEATSKTTKPFFLYFALTAPHTPWVTTPDFAGKSKVGEYGDFTMQVDHTVGEIMKALDRLGLDKNTILVFTSDNGPVWFKEDIEKYNHRATAQFRGMKIDSYEGAHRVPFIVRWPGKVKPNSSSDQLMCFTDILPTLADVVGDPLSSQESKDNFSLLPILLDKGNGKRNGLVVEGHTIREGDWKLIFGNGTGSLQKKYGKIPAPSIEGELYNLKVDPSETTNLYTKQPEKVAELIKRMEGYRE